MQAEARDLRLFAKEFKQRVRQQRVRSKTKERPDALPLALSMIRRIISPQTGNVPDLIEELQRSDQGQAEAPLVETRPVLFSK